EAAAVSVDTATCADCLAEVYDPGDRRHRYPFTNCTNCGPRYTIVLGVPYDRPATTMAGFVMCTACQAEYDDPADRRFHAQPNACSVCGPRLAWRDPSGAVLAEGDTALDLTVAALRAGSVVAVKGLGGYHLAADATSEAAVAELRRRKARDDKPFAVIAADLEGAGRLVVLDELARAALTSPRRPIVLAPRQPDTVVVDAVAPGLPELGVFLPYSALHQLLLSDLGRPLVLTSGNLSDDPIAHADDDAVTRLGPMVDGLLTNDRAIHIRCDDSVVRSLPGRTQVLRRSRGYAPEPMRLPVPTPRHILAVGAELKNTIAVARDGVVVASHHIGDLEHLATYRSFLQALDHLPRLYGVRPEVVAYDLHPEYLSTKVALELGLPTVGVQHHHAHVASCLVEHGRVAPVLGIAFDGTGYGPDGTLWGGELLVADLGGYERVGHLRPIAMPGGVAAIREPWRMALAWLAAAEGIEVAINDRLVPEGVDPAHRAAMADLVARGAGPVTTSMGRLFDAAAALLGVRSRVTYEAQAAIELEALAGTVPRSDAPRYDGTVLVGGSEPGSDVARDAGTALTGATEGVAGRAGGLDGRPGAPGGERQAQEIVGWPVVQLDPRPLIARVRAERDAGVAPALVAAGFHETVGRAVAGLAADLAARRSLDTVVLTGGVFQNARLTEVVYCELAGAGLRVLLHANVPCGDGGISLGQAAIAAVS
ncbi:MAG TPA: carbamoyltransferase HypF, partial [Acidimicrobiales bacterium]|nr:carbamoyltransferase HypF [Acidimicrobiales bacterium]